ncbi:hypothetical protein [Paludibacterium denitrificans]|uniref:Uncharacterized protein n=1 Tax=Paludibacterium denitrificans TaxID=2675226 RepID=A0A844GCB8_9NEIS|nr:hypothetical protein [Paludibacterium denitrificans]MTD32414.1 hypothetical protein [Paludibacterium denitrificans]
MARDGGRLGISLVGLDGVGLVQAGRALALDVLMPDIDFEELFVVRPAEMMVL